MLSFSAPLDIVLIDLALGKATPLVQHPDYELLSPVLSPDNRWLAFHARRNPLARRVYIAPFQPGRNVGESEWIPITDGQTLDRLARWSPDGKLLYYTSERDGFRCIWAQRLDAATKRPAGPAFAVQHFHRSRLAMRTPNPSLTGLSMGGGKMALSLEELTGNIWLARVSGRSTYS